MAKAEQTDQIVPNAESDAVHAPVEIDAAPVKDVREKVGDVFEGKAEALERIWQEFEAQHPTKNLLQYVIWRSEPLRDKAAELLLLQNPTNEDLCHLFFYKYKNHSILRNAWNKLLSQNPTEDHMRYVMNCGFVERWSSYYFEAADKLLSMRPANKDLCNLMVYLNKRREEIAGKILNQNPSIKDLQEVMQWVPSFVEKAWQKFLTYNPTMEILESMLHQNEHVAGKAAAKLLQQTLSDRQLRLIMEKAPSCTESAAALLLNQKPTIEDLRAILETIPSLREKAAGLLLNEQCISEKDFCTIMKKVPLYKEKVAERILSQEHAFGGELQAIIAEVPSHREKAAVILIARSNNKYELVGIMRTVESLCYKAWEKYITCHPTSDEIRQIIKEIKPLRSEAEAILPAIEKEERMLEPLFQAKLLSPPEF